jgi:hypothetical protein
MRPAHTHGSAHQVDLGARPSSRQDDTPTIQGLIGSGLAYAVLPLLTVDENPSARCRGGRRNKPFADRVRGADPSTPVPTCPEWNLGDLIRHVGGTHRELTADEMSCLPGRSDDSEVRVTLPVTPQGTSTVDSRDLDDSGR